MTLLEAVSNFARIIGQGDFFGSERIVPPPVEHIRC